MGGIQRQLVKFVMRVVSFPRTTLAICGALLVGAVLLAWFNLTLSTNQDELLTPKLPFFKDYREFTVKFPENESFVVILEPRDYTNAPPASRWIAYSDQIEARLQQVEDVRRVNTHTPVDELGEQGLLFADWAEVREQSAQVQGFRQLLGIVVEPPTLLDGMVLGTNPTARFFNALARGPAADSRQLAMVVADSLGSAVQRDPDQWRRGIELPSLVYADPKAQRDPSRFGYNMVPNELKRGTQAYHTEKILAINIYTNRDFSSLADVTEPLERMRAAVREVAANFPEFKEPVITGRPALEADEMRTSDRDTRIAEICGLSLIFVVLYLFLRNLWMVVVAEVCLVTGIGWTFGWATLAVGRLNLLSLVFVIALIGIGMDYLIQILTRYRFEKKRYTRPAAVWARVFRYVSAPISTACAGAAGAFLVSRLTNFSGAGELGIIAGGGLLLCLATGYTLLPALLTLFPAGVGKVSVSRRYRLHGRHPRAGGYRLIPAVLWIAVSVGGLIVSWPPTFDANLLNLQASGLESVREVRKLRTWSAVVLANDLDTLRQARDALASRPGEVTTIESTESLLDAADKRAWLVANNAALINLNWREPPEPTVADLHAIADAAAGLVTAWSRQAGAGDLSDVAAKMTALRRGLQDETVPDERKISRVGGWQQAFFRELRQNIGQFAPPPLDIQKLPQDLRDHLVSGRDARGQPSATPTFALYVHPREDLWDTEKLRQFVEELESKFGRFLQERKPEGGTAVLTGIAPQLYHSTQEIHRAFLVSTLYALGLIVLLVLLDLRKLGQTLLAVSVLGLGLPMLLLFMWVWRNVLHDPLGIPGSWNFANFFALPILIGAGHEYGVFMVHRYRETLEDPRRVWHTWDVSDRALLLCGIVTSSSFGFLIGAKHHGLASLGWVMGVGTACIYLATLIVLRPILQWRIKHKGVYDSTSPRASLESARQAEESRD